MLYLYDNKGEIMLALRLPKNIEERLTVLAKKTGRTKSFYARQALIEYIEYMEDMEDYYCAVERMKDRDPSTDLTSEEVKKLHGLED